MKLSYYGHCAFKWTSPAGVRILIDPYGNSEQSYWFVREFPPIETDLLLVTHDHFDHNAEETVPAAGPVHLTQMACVSLRMRCCV